MIKRHKILIYLALVFIFLCVVNIFSLFFNWYNLIWYFDMPMHFIGGIAVLFLFSYMFYDKIFIFSLNKKIFVTMFAVFLLGFAWELYEYLAGVFISHSLPIISDTLSDICFDLAGGLFGLLFLIPFIGNKDNTRV